MIGLIFCNISWITSLAVTLKNYGGGKSPAVIILIAFFLILLVFAGLIYVIWISYKKHVFNRLFNSSTFTKEDRLILRSYFDRVNIEDPLPIITQRHQFDIFSTRIAHLYEASAVSLSEIQREGAILANIRRNLKFTHSFRNKRLNSSQAIPINYVISVTFQNPTTAKYFSFFAKVVDNQELYLGITFPHDADLEEQIYEAGKLSLDVAFARRKDAQYHFYSYLMRMVQEPSRMWLIAHSPHLSRSPLRKPLDLVGTILYSDNDITKEHNVTIAFVNNEECFFITKDLPTELPVQSVVIINFSIDQRTFACQGVIKDVFTREDKCIYQLAFRSLDFETKQALIAFYLRLRNKGQVKGTG